MPVQDQAKHSNEVTRDSIINSIIDSSNTFQANATPTRPSTARIPRVPRIVTEIHEYEKNYVPKVVSIGPYHFQNQKLEKVERLKPVYAMKLLQNKATLRTLYNKLGEPEMVKELRNFYEEGSTTAYSDEVFTKMMLLDGCFIFYCLRFIFLKDCPELNSNEIVFIHQDLYLLENQVPFKVLREVMMVLNIRVGRMKPFTGGSTILAFGKPKSKLLYYIRRCIGKKSWLEEYRRDVFDNEPDHLLHIVHLILFKKPKAPTNGSHSEFMPYKCTFRNVNELVDMGILFKPSSTMSLAHIKFSKGWWGFSPNLELPPITVDDSTKPMLLNLIAYEMGLPDTNNAWVTSYVCLLASLINSPEDVKVLRKAMVLDTSSQSDEDTKKMFNEIATDLVPNKLAYMETKKKIQRHYVSLRSALFIQLKNEYLKSPWAVFALLGALIVLFLTGVQAYFTVWSPKSACDDLCVFLKKNHHL